MCEQLGHFRGTAESQNVQEISDNDSYEYWKDVARKLSSYR